jgi:hypothetical protein
MSTNPSHIRETIQRDDIAAALEQLTALVTQSQLGARYRNEVTLHAAGFRRLQTEARQGLLTPQEQRIERTRLTAALLDLLDALEQDLARQGTPPPAGSSQPAATASTVSEAGSKPTTPAHQPPSDRQPLRVFLCHSSGDKPAVRTLYQQLRAAGIQPWFDEEDLLPGQEWRTEIPRVVRATDVVLVCLSRSSVDRAGYAQKEIKLALDVADEQPEGSIFLIPVKLEECPMPDRLSHLHWVNLFAERGYEQLLRALRYQAERLDRVIIPHT